MRCSPPHLSKLCCQTRLGLQWQHHLRSDRSCGRWKRPRQSEKVGTKNDDSGATSADALPGCDLDTLRPSQPGGKAAWKLPQVLGQCRAEGIKKQHRKEPRLQRVRGSCFARTVASGDELMSPESWALSGGLGRNQGQPAIGLNPASPRRTPDPDESHDLVEVYAEVVCLSGRFSLLEGQQRSPLVTDSVWT